MNIIQGQGDRKAIGLSIVCAMMAFAWVIAHPGKANAQMGPDYWRVSGVSSDDHLNIRSGPGPNHRVVGMAPNGFVFRNLGCRGSGNSRWCHVETPDGHKSGWVAGRFLQESGAPGGGGGGSGSGGAPELHARGSGEMEVRFASGCTVLYNPAGRRITAGSSCSRQQLNQAHDAVERYMREQGGAANHGGGGRASTDVNMNGAGYITGGGRTEGRIFGHSEGHYAVVVTSAADSLTCTGTLAHAPGVVRSETASLHCTNGAAGTALLVTSRNGNHHTLTFNLNDGVGGLVQF